MTRSVRWLTALATCVAIPAAAEPIDGAGARSEPSAILTFAPNSATLEPDQDIEGITTVARALPTDQLTGVRIEGVFDADRLEAAGDAGIAPLELRAIGQAGRNLAIRRAEIVHDALVSVGAVTRGQIALSVARGSESTARMLIE